jgi:hypothetical protein
VAAGRSDVVVDIKWSFLARFEGREDNSDSPASSVVGGDGGGSSGLSFRFATRLAFTLRVNECVLKGGKARYRPVRPSPALLYRRRL